MQVARPELPGQGNLFAVFVPAARAFTRMLTDCGYLGHNVFSMASVKGKELTTSIRPSAIPMEINYDVVNASHFIRQTHGPPGRIDSQKSCQECSLAFIFIW